MLAWILAKNDILPKKCLKCNALEARNCTIYCKWQIHSIIRCFYFIFSGLGPHTAAYVLLARHGLKNLVAVKYKKQGEGKKVKMVAAVSIWYVWYVDVHEYGLLLLSFLKHTQLSTLRSKDCFTGVMGNKRQSYIPYSRPCTNCTDLCCLTNGQNKCH